MFRVFFTLAILVANWGMLCSVNIMVMWIFLRVIARFIIFWCTVKCVLLLGNRCVQEVSLNSYSSCDHDVSTESEWRGPGRVPTMYGTIWGWWPQFLPLHMWLPGEYTLLQVRLFQYLCNHAVMSLIFYEVLIHFLSWISVHSPNRCGL